MAVDDDSTLVRRTIRGDRDAFRGLYDRYRDKVYATALRITGNPEEAADLTHDIFLKLHRELPGFRFQSRFSTWLYRIAVNVCLNRVAEASRHDRIERQVAISHHPPAEGPATDTERILKALSRLSPKLRSVVVLRYVHNLPYDEIAEILDISPGTVKSRLHLAHQALRGFLARAP